jgi:hypothetical protein
MESAKPCWQSQTIWASIFQVAVGLATSTGLINDVAGQVVLSEGPAILIGAVTSVLGIWTFYGRVVATKSVTVSTKA